MDRYEKTILDHLFKNNLGESYDDIAYQCGVVHTDDYNGRLIVKNTLDRLIFEKRIIVKKVQERDRYFPIS